MRGLYWTSNEHMVAELVAGSLAGTAFGDTAMLSIDGSTEAIHVMAFRGSETVNALYRFDVIYTANVELDGHRAPSLGAKVALQLMLPSGSTRYVRGMACHVALCRQQRGRGVFRMTIVPKLWLLGKRKNSRVFQHKNVRQVVADILNAHGVPHVFSLARRYERREYCLQYEETDLAFVTRLLAEEGIFYAFEQPADADEVRESLLTALPGAAVDEVLGLAQGGVDAGSLLGAAERIAQPSGLMQMLEIAGPSEIMVIGDTPAVYGRLAGGDTLRYDPTLSSGAMHADESHLQRFSVSSSIDPTRSTVRDYDPERAGRALAGTIIGTRTQGSIGGALGDLASAGITAAAAPLADATRAGGTALGSATGAASNLAGVPLNNPAALAGSSNESFSHGIHTATHAVMPLETALAKTGIAVGTAIAQQLIPDAGWDSALGSVSDLGQGVLGGTEGALEVYEHHGDYEEMEATAAAAISRLEQHRTGHIVCRGYSHCRRLLPGKSFELRGHEVAQINQAYAITEVVHEAWASPPDDGPIYHNEMTCIPAEIPCRPPRPPRKLQQSVESATVVGPENNEIKTEHHGRIKIQFHWDRLGKHDDRSSCWIRVMQPWNGTGYGFHFIPRIGTEVLVSFVGGDINRPIVIGCVPNLSNPLPYHLPEHDTQSGIRTRSTPNSTGYNELMFDDAAGRETVHLRAERDLTETVQHDHETTVGHDHVVSVAHDERMTITGQREITVGGDQACNVTGERREHTAGDSLRSYDANDFSRVAGTQSVQVRGDMQASAGGSAMLSVAGSCTVSAGGDLSLDAGSTSDPRHMMLSAGGTLAGSAGETVVFNATEGITFTCGDATISLLPDQVVITAPTIKLVASENISATSSGARLTMDDNAELCADQVTVLGSSGIVRASDSVHVGGSEVIFGSGDSAGSDSPGEEESDTQPLNIRVTGPDGEGMANRRYVVNAGGREFRGTTDGEGWVRQDIPADASNARLSVWNGDRPADDRRTWSINIEEMADASDLAGARARLRNLGYAPGAPSEDEPDVIDPATQNALRRFQRDHELEETGELDEQTISALREAHES